MNTTKQKTRGGIRRRGGKWEIIVHEGRKPAHRCKDCGRLYWDDRQRNLTKCPNCGGPLEPTTEKRQTSRGGFRTQAEAKAARAELVHKVNQGVYVNTNRLTVAEYLRETWLPAIPSTIRESTLNSYRCHVEKHIIPALGAKRLRDLDGPMLNGFYAEQAAGGHLVGRKKVLAPASVRRIHATLHRALKDAVRWGLIARNPADASDPPKAEADARERLKYWRPEQLHAFLVHTEGDRLWSLWAFMAATGVRRGEALGLRWSDVDLGAGTVAIRNQLVPVNGKIVEGRPKTKAGRRVLPLGTETRRILMEQASLQSSDSDRLDAAWTATGYVFTNEDGNRIDPARATLLFGRSVKAAALPRITLHDLRHTFATMALKAGIHPKIVQEMLGHSKVTITLDMYSHVIPGMAEDAAGVMNELVFARRR